MQRKSEKIHEISVINTQSPKKPRLGTRLVNLDILRDGLVCKICSEKLSLHEISAVRKIGGADEYQITCQDCLHVNHVYTSNHRVSEDGCRIFNVNCRIALGAINAGMGCGQVNKFFADLNVPIINEHTFKRHERMVGVAIEKVAKKSCQDAAKSEREQTVDQIETVINMM